MLYLTLLLIVLCSLSLSAKCTHSWERQSLTRSEHDQWYSSKLSAGHFCKIKKFLQTGSNVFQYQLLLVDLFSISSHPQGLRTHDGDISSTTGLRFSEQKNFFVVDDDDLGQNNKGTKQTNFIFTNNRKLSFSLFCFALKFCFRSL